MHFPGLLAQQSLAAAPKNHPQNPDNWEKEHKKCWSRKYEDYCYGKRCTITETNIQVQGQDIPVLFFFDAVGDNYFVKIFEFFLVLVFCPLSWSFLKAIQRELKFFN